MMESDTCDAAALAHARALSGSAGGNPAGAWPKLTEMAIHIGYVQCGMPGMLVAGACFIVPAFP